MENEWNNNNNHYTTNKTNTFIDQISSISLRGELRKHLGLTYTKAIIIQEGFLNRW